MSDFIGRIAARAVGDAPSAQPRAPSAFEALGGDVGIEVIDVEAPAATAPRVNETPPVVAGREPSAAAPARAAPVAARGEPAAPEQAAPATRATPKPAPPVASAATAEAEVREPAFVAAQPKDRGREQAAPTPEPPVESAPTPAATPIPVAIAKPVTPAVPTLARASEPASSTATAATAEPPPVRVHIGRLEVRANLQQPTPERRQARDDERPQELSLADYLRGKRATG